MIIYIITGVAMIAVLVLFYINHKKGYNYLDDIDGVYWEDTDDNGDDCL